MPGKYKVFISHAGEDVWVAKQIEAHINECGAEAFLDATDITFGEEFDERIREELLNCDELLVLLTPWALERPYIWVEVGGAWLLKKRIIGVLHGLTAGDISAMKRVPVLIKRLNLIEINDLNLYFDQLKERVKKKDCENGSL